jgi:hypothetical protein
VLFLFNDLAFDNGRRKMRASGVAVPAESEVSSFCSTRSKIAIAALESGDHAVLKNEPTWKKLLAENKNFLGR